MLKILLVDILQLHNKNLALPLTWWFIELVLAQIKSSTMIVRVDRASATETVDTGSITGPIKSKTIKIGIDT